MRYLSNCVAPEDDVENVPMTVEFVGTEFSKDVRKWFDALPPAAVKLMDKEESASPPRGEGWIVDIHVVARNGKRAKERPYPIQ